MRLNIISNIRSNIRSNMRSNRKFKYKCFSMLISMFFSVAIFKIEYYGEQYKVFPPTTPFLEIALTVSNNSISKILWKISNNKNKILTFMSLDPQTTKSINLSKEKGERLFVIPQTPPGQEIELTHRHAPYTIP